jgi:hypothetical protein
MAFTRVSKGRVPVLCEVVSVCSKEHNNRCKGEILKFVGVKVKVVTNAVVPVSQ